VSFSLERARRGGALAWWGDLPAPTPVPKDPMALAFATTDGLELARTLSSPLFALVPRGFDPRSPDGTGAMFAEVRGPRLLLRRNPNAARGASFLEEIAVDQAPDLLASPRSFEGNLTDIGWLSSGLHVPRPGSADFDLGRIAWIVLQSGAEAGPWGAPGVAQRLLDGLNREGCSGLDSARYPRRPASRNGEASRASSSLRTGRLTSKNSLAPCPRSSRDPVTRSR
jgi:peptide/nickel transport system substrate-binding protein